MKPKHAKRYEHIFGKENPCLPGSMIEGCVESESTYGLPYRAFSEIQETSTEYELTVNRDDYIPGTNFEFTTLAAVQILATDRSENDIETGDIEGEISNKNCDHTSTELVVYTTSHDSLNADDEASHFVIFPNFSAAGTSRTPTPNPTNSRIPAPNPTKSRTPTPDHSNHRVATRCASHIRTPFDNNNPPTNTPTAGISQNRPFSNTQAA
ncbi:Uncharacterized protein APZ42_011931 [Daphnia magna]|uniref:Uncharacterized protein n=1 Tax=Daphnia magna TaxID=35525 RepID=A0A0P5MTD4_9CRUS|nr:Uncharacterized protein APZ42_011931 [Daphnia magna]